MVAEDFGAPLEEPVVPLYRRGEPAESASVSDKPVCSWTILMSDLGVRARVYLIYCN